MYCKGCGKEVDAIVTEVTDAGPHHAKQQCPICLAFLGWASKPKNETKRLKSKFTPESLEVEHCEICLRPKAMLGRWETLEIHHKMPIELGGEDVRENILVVCTYCHKDIHARHTYLYDHFRPNEIPHLSPREVPEPNKTPLVNIPLISGEEWPVYNYQINEWDKSYPAVDILQELRKIREWCLSNPRRRKTLKGVRRFVTNWLSRVQDKGGSLNKKNLPWDERPFFFPKP